MYLHGNVAVLIQTPVNVALTLYEIPMKIKKPTAARLHVINQCYDGKMDPDVLTDWEFAWLQNTIMEAVVNRLSETNPMAFGGEECPSIH